MGNTPRGHTSTLGASRDGSTTFDDPNLLPTQRWLPPGTVVGPYAVVTQLGRGGMGDVYLAERNDGQFERRVALKVIRQDQSNRELMERFLAERQIVANLHHPNIAALLEGGVDAEARPYCALEYIEGVELCEHCDENMVSLEGRLDLFLQICSAVHYAHQRLVIHQDLKPSNVLVTPSGQVKLLDFGVAELISPRRTPASSPSGSKWITLEYAAPEQVQNADISTATDVYQLGGILYELLTGVRPFAAHAESTQQLREAICEVAPPPASEAVNFEGDFGREARRSLPGDLDSILARALQKGPEMRYESAWSLAEDVRAYLRQRPVNARGGGATYRARKWVARHRLATAWAAFAALTLLAYVITVTLQARRLADERDRTAIALKRTQNMSAFLMDLFETSDRQRDAGDEISAAELVDRGVERIERLGGEPQLQAQLLSVTGRAYAALGHFERADNALREALRLREKNPQTPPLQLTESLTRLAEVLTRRAQYEEAQRLFERALSVRKLVPDDTAEPQESTVLNGLAVCLLRLGQFEEAATAAETALGLTRAGEVRAKSLQLLTGIYGSLGDYEKAEAYGVDAVAASREFFGPKHIEVAGALTNLAIITSRKEYPATAIEYFREALEISRAVQGERHPSVAQTRLNLGSALSRIGGYEEATSHYLDALEIGIERYGDEHPFVATTLNNLGDALYMQWKFADAEPYQRRALAMRESLLGPDHPDVARSAANLAGSLIHLDAQDEAQDLLLGAIPRLRAQLGADHPFVDAACKDGHILLRFRPTEELRALLEGCGEN